MPLIFAALLTCTDAQLLISRLSNTRVLTPYEMREVYAEIILAAPADCRLRPPKGVGRDF